MNVQDLVDNMMNPTRQRIRGTSHSARRAWLYAVILTTSMSLQLIEHGPEMMGQKESSISLLKWKHGACEIGQFMRKERQNKLVILSVGVMSKWWHL